MSTIQRNFSLRGRANLDASNVDQSFSLRDYERNMRLRVLPELGAVRLTDLRRPRPNREEGRADGRGIEGLPE
jgi:hypothetical protein